MATAEVKTDTQAGLEGLRLINQMIVSYVPSRCLSAGVQLGFFSLIAEGSHTVEEIAARSECSVRGTSFLLDALCSVSLLTKAGDQYELSQPAEKYLVRGAPDYVGAMVERDMFWRVWDNLTEVVRTGEPVNSADGEEEGADFFQGVIGSLHVTHGPPARRTAQVLLEEFGREDLDVLDVACGSGIWGIATAEASPQTRITMNDFPAMLEVTRDYLRRHGFSDRAQFLPGDLKTVDYGEEQFDAAILGNIVHSEGESSSRELFARLHRAIRPGGRIAIFDMIPNEDRTGPVMPVTFALTMLLNTKSGGTYTFEEYREWLEDAGYADVRRVNVNGHSPLILATRP